MRNLFRNIEPAAVFAARLLIGWIFIYDAVDAIVHYGAVGDYLESNGVSNQLLPLAIVTELIGGILVAVGWYTRLASLALAGFCLLTALLFHAHFGDPIEVIHFNKDLAIAGGFLALVAFGAGRWSLDVRFARRRPASAQRSGRVAL